MKIFTPQEKNVLSLSQNERQENSFLGYLLRRRVLSIETLTSKANDAMIIAVNWLSRVFNQLLDFCHKNSLKELSMKHFMVKDLPLESSHQFRIWFVDLWNLVLVEEFKLRKIRERKNITEDPVKLITRTWPWKDQDGGLSQALRPLLTRGANNTGDEDIFNKDPLVRKKIRFFFFCEKKKSKFILFFYFQMDMLLCLQEATKESSNSSKDPKIDL